ncbi:hypothetical protein A2Z33_03190 [Candidatus Gottesmanbacteria bacterium RBG_16_52_11]|uniref:DUF5667 domain-containing protein n=1 Tax=Candidatus Gottesmanbacteria bacterium RBG_16_52_11 TaxID=1798374 RepID=A0A1F5YV93_9BACT|nr:MAG: hypothetical protein A2Z33_03190 [Candidatus Gottesmanbacteria bacterium RBG_16_52_11]
MNASYDVSAQGLPAITGQMTLTPSLGSGSTGTAASDLAGYPLPYPGILPDHPLYFLKQLRDFILEHAVSDPDKRVEFHILQSDKNLVMAMEMADLGKWQYAERAAAAAASHRNKAYLWLVSQRSAGQPAPPYLIDRLVRSVAKHLEILSGLLRAQANSPAWRSYFTEAGELEVKLTELPRD